METRRFRIWSIPLLACTITAAEPLWGTTVSATYSFVGSAQNQVIENGFLIADGLASGSLNEVSGVTFETHNSINLTTLQNYGTFTILLPGGDTAFGNLYENDVNVSLVTFSGPFTQELTFTGGTGQFANVSGILTGGGFIYPTYYTTSGAGTLNLPAFVATPEPRSVFLLLVGLAALSIVLLKRYYNPRARETHFRLALSRLGTSAAAQLHYQTAVLEPACPGGIICRDIRANPGQYDGHEKHLCLDC